MNFQLNKLANIFKAGLQHGSVNLRKAMGISVWNAGICLCRADLKVSRNCRRPLRKRCQALFYSLFSKHSGGLQCFWPNSWSNNHSLQINVCVCVWGVHKDPAVKAGQKKTPSVARGNLCGKSACAIVSHAFGTICHWGTSDPGWDISLRGPAPSILVLPLICSWMWLALFWML